MPATRLPRMHRPTLSDAVGWIAMNDNAGSGDDAAAIAGYLTTTLVADLFGRTPDYVAARIRAVRDDEGMQ